MRDYFESLEDSLLAPYAVKSKTSLGRKFNEPLSQTRTCFQRDRDRIVYSKAFRRLKDKTQVFVAFESDHYRSRLTHSIEVAQIARHLSRLLRLNEDLSESIALAHDLGHTPFGHSGEDTLNKLLKEYGGFEHNTQSLRIVDHLEDKYPEFFGLNLSQEILDGLRKHKALQSDQFQQSLEAQLVNLSDEIAYNNHDLEDGISANLLSEENLKKEVPLFLEAAKTIEKNYSNLEKKQRLHLIHSALISSQVLDVFHTTKTHIENNSLNSLQDIQHLKQPIVTFSPEMREKNRQLRRYLFTHFYQHPTITQMNLEGKKVIESLYDYFQSHPESLPLNFQAHIKESNQSFQRILADYISGMTDNYALKKHKTFCTG